MQGEWLAITDEYSINEEGLVQNDLTERILKRSFMTNGEPAVSFRIDSRLVRRQVISLMAETWMEPHELTQFDTPMHLDGDRNNCHVTNLVFRPRWFVIAYNKDCNEVRFPNWDRPFRLIDTNEIFDNPWDCARAHGFLQRDIVLSIVNKTHLFPGARMLEWI